MGQNQQLVDLVGTKSYDEILEKVSAFTKKNLRILFEIEAGIRMIGKFADFTVYSDNLMEIPIEEVPRIKAEQIFIAGKRVN